MNDDMSLNRRVIITGGPGAGKTSLINLLHQGGHSVAPEAGRAVIRQEMARGGLALPWQDAAAFARAMWCHDRQAYAAHGSQPGWVFFDRGLPDILGYCRLAGIPPWPELIESVGVMRYHPLVFIAPPWRAIFVQDAERRQDFAEAQATFHQMRRIYTEAGYCLRLLPRADIAHRRAFVLHELAQFTEASRVL